MIKAIFFDIDGTLVSFKTHLVPEETKEALRALKAKGIKIFIATGRSGILMKEVGSVDSAMFDGLLTFNGQHCKVDGEVVYSNPIPREDTLAGIRFFDSHDISCIFEGSDFVVINSHDAAARSISEMLAMRLPPPINLHEVDHKETIQLIFFGDAEQEKGLLEVMPSCESTRWHPAFTDIIPRGGGKHIGMEKVLKHFGISREECMAFGDGENDVTMLQHAGIGVAMGNATDDVKSHADWVTTSVDEQGIPNALRHFGIL